MLSLTLGVAVVVTALRLLVVEPFYVPSRSMVPTLKPGGHAIAFKPAYAFGDPHRNDIVVLEDPRGEHDLLVKRVVGLAGQTVAVRDGVLVVDGVPLREAYVNYERADSTFFAPVTVPPDSVFVMGDNRTNSVDSRVFGAVPESALVGRVLLRLDF